MSIDPHAIVWIAARDPLPGGPGAKWQLKAGCRFPVQSRFAIRAAAPAFGVDQEWAWSADWSQLDYVRAALPCGCASHDDDGSHERTTGGTHGV